MHLRRCKYGSTAHAQRTCKRPHGSYGAGKGTAETGSARHLKKGDIYSDMQTDDKTIVLGEVTDVLLWGFKLELTDRRTGERLEGYAVETGNDDYELDDAAQSIRNRFGAMGYSVNSCTFDTERKYTYDAVKEFEAAEPTNAGKEPQETEDDEKSSYKDEIEATLAELGE